ncbi:MAG: hypothetical protein CMO01_07370 [Thalassobius sp.]|nr:hypothetical protein [Thalassovita sp.]
MKKLKIYQLAIPVVVSFLVQSCFVAKNYQQPELSTENLYRTDLELDSNSLASMSWDKLFTDPVLQGYIRSGLENNYDMLIALQTLKAAESNMLQGKASYLPTIDIGPTWTHQTYSKNSQFGRLFSGSLDQFEFTANASWEADIWGKIRSTKRSAIAGYLSTYAAQQAIQTELVANIASVYYQILAADSQLKVAESTLENRIESVEVIRSLKESGSVNEVAVKQTEAQQYSTEIIIQDLKYNIKILENTLSILLGEAPSDIDRGVFEEQAINAEVNPGVPALLLSRRPDVVSAELAFRQAFENTNVAKSNFYPSLTITAAVGLQSLELRNWFSANSIFSTLITGITQPILNKRQIRTNYEVAQANQQTAYLQYEQALLNAGKEVSDALAMYKNETEKMTIRNNQLEALRSAADYSDELLQYGLVNYLEVLTAKDSALSAELELINNKYNQLNAVITLYRSLGGGYQPLTGIIPD